MSLAINPEQPNAVSIGTVLSEALGHGGLQRLADMGKMTPRLKAMGITDPVMMARIAQIPSHFFYRIVDNKPYTLSPALIDYLTKDGSGLLFNDGDQPSPDILAPMTFVGQFIDHDVTLNAVNLLMQTPMPNQLDEASPLIDLDHVFGPRVDDNNPGHDRFIPRNPNGTFVLHEIEGGFGTVDVPRGPDKKALIGDKRNDENQLILQVHLLMMRLNNALIEKQHLSKADAQRETILHWQSFVATQYLPLVCREAEIDLVRSRLEHDPNSLLNRPVNGQVRMPHEFAIAFRFGHSQLRDMYRLQPGKSPIPLFDTRATDDPNELYDLSGSKYLASDHVVDWEFFLGAHGDHSNLIDTKVNQVVFKLPPSTIPDADTQILNLPERNLLRSSGLGLCAGEDLVDAYNAQYGAAHAIPKLTQAQVIGSGDAALFMDHGTFRTPLWFYILREAEFLSGKDGGKVGQLGPLGSRLVAEVILSAIQYATPSFLRTPQWQPLIQTSTGKARSVNLIDIARFVT